MSECLCHTFNSIFKLLFKLSSLKSKFNAFSFQHFMSQWMALQSVVMCHPQTSFSHYHLFSKNLKEPLFSFYLTSRRSLAELLQCLYKTIFSYPFNLFPILCPKRYFENTKMWISFHCFNSFAKSYDKE